MSSAAPADPAETVGLPPGAAQAVIDGLVARHLTLGVAESLTGGLITAALTDVPGASAAVRGALVVYATDLKTSLAGVDPTLLRAVGAVHPEVARQLADGARIRLSADWGFGITGVAGPTPQDGVPVGTVFSCLTTAHATVAYADRFTGNREAVRAAATRRAVTALADALAREHEPPGAR